MTEQEVPAGEPATPEVPDGEDAPSEQAGTGQPMEGIEVEEGETGEITQTGDEALPDIEETPA